MVEMYEICKGMFIPKECVSFTGTQVGGGEVLPDDEGLPCGDGCGKVCEKCIIQEVFNDYARLTGYGQGTGQDTLAMQAGRIARKYMDMLEGKLDYSVSFSVRDLREVYDGIQTLGHIAASLERFARLEPGRASVRRETV